jgi:hypothetical protein
VIAPEDDTRSFWVFVKTGCRHTIGVLTDDGYNRQQALEEMYGGKRAAKKALFDDGIDVRLVDAPEYHEQVFEAIRKGCTCPA